jgi:transposase
LSQGQKQAINQEIIKALAVSATPPQERTEKPKPRWTLKRLVHWVKEKWKVSLCRETIRRILKKQGLSWKKAKKLLNKANPTKRKEFLLTLEKLFQEAIQDNHLLVYLDEAHIHLDCDLGYGWSIRGERFWVSSCSPGLQKVSFYGAYLYNEANVRLFSFDTANQFNTIEVLKQLRVEFPDRKITVIWDQAPYHRALSVKMAAVTLDIAIEPLPSYSPDFMPVEHLWRWLREDVTYHTCYPTKEKLIQQVNQFVDTINLDPFSVSDRLWAQNHLEPEEEKLRVST